MFIQNFLSWAFWFNSRPEILKESTQKSLVGLATVLGIVVLISYLKAYPKHWSVYRPTFQKLIPFSLTNAVIALYFVFLNNQIIPVLRSHYWYLIWLVIAAWWLSAIILDTRKRLQRKEVLAHEAEKQKYLPR